MVNWMPYLVNTHAKQNKNIQLRKKVINLQEDTLAPYLFIICLDYVLRTSIEKNQRKRFQANKEKM